MAVSEELKAVLRAHVVDVRDDSSATERRYVVDANVLMFSTYDRFDQQRLLGQSAPWDEQLDAYLRYERRIRASGAVLYTSMSALFEFIRTLEIAELRILWAELNASAAHGDFSGFDPKGTRRSGGSRYETLRDRVHTYLVSLSKRYELLSPPNNVIEVVAGFNRQWRDGLIDSGDAHLLADSERHGIVHVISGDQDLSTVPSITLYTANRVVIDTARAAGRLSSGRRT